MHVTQLWHHTYINLPTIQQQYAFLPHFLLPIRFVLSQNPLVGFVGFWLFIWGYRGGFVVHWPMVTRKRRPATQPFPRHQTAPQTQFGPFLPSSRATRAAGPSFGHFHRPNCHLTVLTTRYPTHIITPSSAQTQQEPA